MAAAGRALEHSAPAKAHRAGDRLKLASLVKLLDSGGVGRALEEHRALRFDPHDLVVRNRCVGGGEISATEIGDLTARNGFHVFGGPAPDPQHGTRQVASFPPFQLVENFPRGAHDGES